MNIRGRAEPFSRGSRSPLSEFDLNGGNRKNKGRHPLTLSLAEGRGAEREEWPSKAVKQGGGPAPCRAVA